MSTISIATELAEQYERAWRMFRAAVELFTEEQWRAGAISSLVPARHACHVVETADFYCASVPPDEFKWGSRVGGFWDTAPARNLPSQEHVLEYLDDVEQKVAAWLHGLTDEAMLGPDGMFPWTGRSLLGRAVYLLRHTQHHLAEMNAELRRRGRPVLDWR